MRIAESVTFGGGGLSRAAHLRADRDALARAWQAPGARVLLFWRGKPLVDFSHGARLALLPVSHKLIAAAGGALQSLFLGFAPTGDPRFAAALTGWAPDDGAEPGESPFDESEQPHPDLPMSQRFAGIRRVMALLPALDAEMGATAKALLAWHARHGFCPSCGAPSTVTMAGWQRDCPSCGTAHFPRTDPVVIMLITDGNSTLLGRSPGWPAGMYSCLAGFLEPGETVEAAVRREVWEETGVPVGRVRYLASQPWPYPSSLMIGCHGVALEREIRLDEDELEDALWVSREALLSALAGTNEKIRPARNGSIAHFLLQNWLADRLE